MRTPWYTMRYRVIKNDQGPGKFVQVTPSTVGLKGLRFDSRSRVHTSVADSIPGLGWGASRRQPMLCLCHMDISLSFSLLSLSLSSSLPTSLPQSLKISGKNILLG